MGFSGQLDFYMYWHLEFLIFIFIQEYFDPDVIRDIFYVRPSGKKVVSSHSLPRDSRVLFRSTFPSIFCKKKLNFLIPDGSSIRAFITPTPPQPLISKTVWDKLWTGPQKYFHCCLTMPDLMTRLNIHFSYSS